jgi:polyisoprenoid-binding protein YceI
MNKESILLSAFFLIVLCAFKAGERTTWMYDKAHAKLGFSISHLMIADVEGSFKNVTATITSSDNDFTDAVVEMSAQVNSIDTDNEQRDTHLKSPAFFDAEKYPTITLKSTSFRKTQVANTFEVTGNLTMHGVTKSITLTAIARMGVNPIIDKPVAGFKITSTLNRKDFGIAEATAAAILGEEVNVLANAEFIKN